MKKFFAIILTLAALAAALWFSPARKQGEAFFRHAAGPGQEEVPEKYVSEVERRLIDYTIDVAGDVAPEFQLEVKSEVGGKVKALYMEPGQVVKAGELLCEMDDTDLQNERMSAQTDIEGQQLVVDKALRNFERTRKLFADKLITKETFDNDASDLAMCRNSLVKSQRKLQSIMDRIAKARIVAPSAGTVLEVKVMKGQVVVPAASVNAGTTLMIIADLSKLLVTTNINQVDVACLHVKQTVKLTVESVKEETMEGEITFIAPVATIRNNVKGFQVQALVLKPSPRLRPGMTVNLTVPVAHAEDVVAVPSSAVFRGEHESRVVYVLTDGKPESRAVQIGVTSIDFAEVTSGLTPGERILTVAPSLLKKSS